MKIYHKICRSGYPIDPGKYLAVAKIWTTQVYADKQFEFDGPLYPPVLSGAIWAHFKWIHYCANSSK